MDKLLTCLLMALYLLNPLCLAWAQTLNGQKSNGPIARNSVNSASSNNSGSYTSSPGARGNYSQANTAPIVAPVSTIGNTPSSLQSGLFSSRSSGSSARGSTVNSNINNTANSARTNRPPVGNSIQTSKSPNAPSASLKKPGQ